MALSINNRFAAGGTLKNIKDKCESLMRGDERPEPTRHLTLEQRLELFDQARAIVIFYVTVIERNGRRLEHSDAQIYSSAGQYARHLAQALKSNDDISATIRMELTDWLEIDRRRPRIHYQYV